tara:strand:+ start:1140 stop:1769 length:630 start_codon:yes stop_codon:yes gene_type:complete
MRLFGLITVALVAMAVIAITPIISQNMKGETVTKNQSGMGEGIKVHGDWKVKVTDPETGQEELYAFRNAFLNANALILAIIGQIPDGINGENHKYDPEGWVIAGNIIGSGNSGYSACKGEDVNLQSVVVFNSGNVVEMELSDNSSHSLRLTGDCVAQANGDLNSVSTLYVDPVYKNSTNFSSFTYHEMVQPISVQEGQTISYDVVISFD